MDTERLIGALESSDAPDSWGRLVPSARDQGPEGRDALSHGPPARSSRPPDARRRSPLLLAPVRPFSTCSVGEPLAGRRTVCAESASFFSSPRRRPARPIGSIRKERRGVWEPPTPWRTASPYSCTRSFRHRRRSPGAALVYSVLGATVVGAGGYLGGHLAYRRRGAKSTRRPSPAGRPNGPPSADATISPKESRTAVGRWRRAGRDRERRRGPWLEDRCTHRGGPLHEGTLDGTWGSCPWHGSVFEVRDGSVVAGPASAPPARLRRRVSGAGQVEIRRDEKGALRLNPVR